MEAQKTLKVTISDFKQYYREILEKQYGKGAKVDKWNTTEETEIS
jgi:hypothetical protein